MMTPADFELLSAYLDNALNMRERSALEARLVKDAALRAALDELRGIKSLLGDLPVLQPPRSFTLDPVKFARRAWWSRLDAFRMLGGLVSAAAALLLVIGVLSSANSVQTGVIGRASGTIVGINPTPLPPASVMVGATQPPAFSAPRTLTPMGMPEQSAATQQGQNDSQGGGELEFGEGAAESELPSATTTPARSETDQSPVFAPLAATAEMFQGQASTATRLPTATDNAAAQGLIAATSAPLPTIALGTIDQATLPPSARLATTATLRGTDDAMQSATLANQNLLMTLTAAVDIVQTSAAFAPTTTQIGAAGAPLIAGTPEAATDAAEPTEGQLLPTENPESTESDKSRRDEAILEPQPRLLILGGIILLILGGLLFLIGLFRIRR